jgi:hypothetical protein
VLSPLPYGKQEHKVRKNGFLGFLFFSEFKLQTPAASAS